MSIKPLPASLRSEHEPLPVGESSTADERLEGGSQH